MEKINRELLKGSSEILVLKVLQAGPLYGYEIAKKIKTLSREVFQLGEGTLYPLLHKMEKGRLLDAYWQERNGRKRKYYEITRKGLEFLRERTGEWSRFSQAMKQVVG